MDLETLSNRILDSIYGLELEHSNDIFENNSPSENVAEDNELTHYGVKGMKWGVRKEREHSNTKKKSGSSNATKTLRSRLSDLNSQLTKRKAIKSKEKREKALLKEQEKQRKEQIEQEKAVINKKTESNYQLGKKAKSTSTMTDQEIRDAIARMQLEKQYKELAKQQESYGERFVKSVLNEAGKKLAVNYTVKYATLGIDSIIKKTSKSSTTTSGGTT